MTTPTPTPTWDDFKKELPGLLKSSQALASATVGAAFITAAGKLEKAGTKLVAYANKLETEAENNNK